MLSDADAAALYDRLNPWDIARHPGDAFYHDLVMAAGDVLDVGCGTGAMLHRARESGHPGRLAGIDPDRAALGRARRRGDVEWVDGRAADVSWDAEFDLATMVSHAFQGLVDDDEVRALLTAIRAALRNRGRLVFETRHPQARAWEDWNPANSSGVVDPDGHRLRVAHPGRVGRRRHRDVDRDDQRAGRNGPARRSREPALPGCTGTGGVPGRRRVRGRGPVRRLAPRPRYHLEPRDHHGRPPPLALVAWRHS